MTRTTFRPAAVCGFIRPITWTKAQGAVRRGVVNRSTRLIAVGLAAVTFTARAPLRAVESARGTNTPSGTASASASASVDAEAAGAGDFGTLKKICGPGNATGGSGRGITATAIKVGTMSDPGSTVAPGLGQEFFEVGDAFVKWCNAAGGINGRKIQLTEYDAKLFNVAQQMIQACQTDFMLVGNGNGLDDAGREAAHRLQARSDPVLRRLAGGHRAPACRSSRRPTRQRSSRSVRSGCWA